MQARVTAIRETDDGFEMTVKGDDGILDFEADDQVSICPAASADEDDSETDEAPAGTSQDQSQSS